jgi:hypothetical protein
MLREYKPLPSNPVQAELSCYFTPKFIFNFHSFSEEGWSSRSTTESKNQAEASQAAAKGGGKKMPSSQEGQTKFYP